MAVTNMFATGDKVLWRGEVGTIKRNDNDFRYWVVEFDKYTQILHYEDLTIHYINKLKGESRYKNNNKKNKKGN